MSLLKDVGRASEGCSERKNVLYGTKSIINQAC